MNAIVKQTIEHWGHLLPYANIPHNELEYRRLLNFVDELMAMSHLKKDERITSLLNLVAKNIATYEERQYPTKLPSPTEMLQFLMEEHRLGQEDLPEIGSQSLVSKILSGERQLTVEHIKRLSRRFHISPAVFIEGLDENRIQE